jgi:hypothetical protein
MKKVLLVLWTMLLILTSELYPQNRIQHNEQDIFLSGMNLAWINFANDLTNFNATEFTRALDEISAQGGNSIRWWLHVDGSHSPQFTSGMVSGITNQSIQNMKHGLDLAAERGMGIVMCLWSFDMLRASNGSTINDRNRLMLTDDAYLQAYIDYALIPMLDSVGDHPAVICWEVFNEPEGMSNEFGWADIEHVPMADIQKFINRVAGTVHREVPGVLVSNGCWSFLAGTDVAGNHNYYTDTKLIDAGGDADGTLDFYMVHYYDWGGTAISPFHHPASYWDLDKPLVIGEFAAHGPYPGITPIQAYNYLYDNGYAGGLSWTWTGHDGNGDVTDAGPAMLDLYIKHPDDIIINYDNLGINMYPKLIKVIPDTAIERNSGMINYVNLKNHYYDSEDGTSLTYAISEQTNPEIVAANLTSDSIVQFNILDTMGVSLIRPMATDSGGKSLITEFAISVFDTTSVDRALFRLASSSTIESATYRAVFAVDGDNATRWSTTYKDEQWFKIQLEKPRTIQQIMLNWEAAYGNQYRILESVDGENWDTVFTELYGNGQKDLIILHDNVPAQYIMMDCLKRATQWGYSLWSFELYDSIGENTPPFLLSPIDTVSAIAGIELNQSISQFFADTTLGDQLVYTADYSSNPDVADWLSLTSPDDQAEAAFTGTPGENNLGSFTVDVTATDRFGESISTSFILSVASGLGINDPLTSMDIMLYPNPTTGKLTVELSKGKNIVKANLLDMNGKVVSMLNPHSQNNTIQFDLSGLDRGLYFIKVQDNQGIYTAKIIKK